MKRITTLLATAALVFVTGTALTYGQAGPVKMAVSGTNLATGLDLAPNTITDEVIMGGNGTLGAFTYREVHADVTTPQSSNACVGGAGLYIPTLSGGGVFRFQDGSLLAVSLTDGSLCINLTTGVAAFNANYKITGGTGRFKHASGVLTLNSAVLPVVFTAANTPVLLANAGEFQGQISGVTIGDQDGQQ